MAVTRAADADAKSRRTYSPVCKVLVVGKARDVENDSHPLMAPQIASALFDRAGAY